MGRRILKQTILEQADQRLATAALEKQRRGKKPGRDELAALRRCEKQLDDRNRAEHFRSVRKGEWAKWSGRQVKIINQHAERYGAPLLGATFDLTALARWLHDFLADIAPILAASKHTAAIDGETPALERFRAARADREEWSYQRDLGRWVEVDKVREGLGIFSGILRSAGETLQRQCGDEAHVILEEAIADAIHAFHSHFGDPAADESPDAKPADDPPAQ